MARPAAYYMQKYGVPEWLGNALIGKESGGDDKARSPKNARGRMQIHLPSHPNVTLAQAEDPDFAMDYGFRLLAGHKKEFGTWRLALAAYNAGAGAVKKYGGVPPYRETQDYVKIILGKRVAVSPKSTMSTMSTPAQTVGNRVPTASLMPPGQPDLQAASLQGLQDLASGSYSPTKALGDLRASVPPSGVAQPVAREAHNLEATGSSPVSAPGSWSKWVKTPAPRQGPSQPHQPHVLEAVGRIGKRLGIVLEPWGNESHSLTTVDGNASDHGPGNAADVPAEGARLRRIGYGALLEAGMPKKQALKAAQTGGLFNYNGWQVIFATDIGGDHSDHVHIRPPRGTQ